MSYNSNDIFKEFDPLNTDENANNENNNNENTNTNNDSDKTNDNNNGSNGKFKTKTNDALSKTEGCMNNVFNATDEKVGKPFVGFTEKVGAIFKKWFKL